MWISEKKYYGLVEKLEVLTNRVEKLAVLTNRVEELEKLNNPLCIHKTINGKDEPIDTIGWALPSGRLHVEYVSVRKLLEFWAKDMRYERGTEGHLHYRDEDD